jgi:bifunctional DNA-binding transcriptional regulator/antitoxin component of YhaV-PrlF toxin-antitoxin module
MLAAYVSRESPVRSFTAESIIFAVPLPFHDRVKDMSAISRKNQVTLPVEALRAAGLEPGDDVQVRAIAPGRLELVRADELIAEFAGAFDAKVYPEGYLDELRREWP